MPENDPDNLPPRLHRDRDLEFDVFHVEGDVSRLPGQRFPAQVREKKPVPQGPIVPRDLEDQSDGPALQKLIRDARISQQDACIKTRAIHGRQSPVIRRSITDAAGDKQARVITDAGSPDHLRQINDSAGPEYKRTLTDSEGPQEEMLVPGSAEIPDLLKNVREAQRTALEQLRAMKDAQGPSFVRLSTDAVGPIRLRQAKDHQGPVINATRYAPGSGPSTQRDITDTEGLLISQSLESADLHERIRRARAAQQNALNLLKAMQDAQGPSDKNDMIDVSLRIARARDAQVLAMAKLRSIDDFAGPADARQISDEEGPVKSRALADSAGDIEFSPMNDSIGPATENHATDTLGPERSRNLYDAPGPGIPRNLTDAAAGKPPTPADAEGPVDMRLLTDAEGPSDLRIIKDSIGPKFLRAIRDAFAPKASAQKADAPKVNDKPVPEKHTGSLTERMAKIREDQIKTLEMLKDKRDK